MFNPIVMPRSCSAIYGKIPKTAITVTATAKPCDLP
ncbi:Uncharacterised protein [Vibrio cholerae]|nr:Uncharacterised protein [Vibrio cholerae]CSD36636.1 Uncharacterised protein [Vibrio cholerae]